MAKDTLTEAERKEAIKDAAYIRSSVLKKSTYNRKRRMVSLEFRDPVLADFVKLVMAGKLKRYQFGKTVKFDLKYNNTNVSAGDMMLILKMVDKIE